MDGENWNDDEGICWGQWDTLWWQCNENGYDGDTPYYWTEECEVLWLMSESWDLWYTEEESWWVMMKQARKLRQPKHNSMKAASNRQIARLARKDAFKAKVQVLALHGAKHVKTMQEGGQYPGSECFGVWPLSRDCDNQWYNWFEFCDEGEWSDERCQGSVDEWFAADLDFKTPDSLGSCSEFSWDMSPECWTAWETLMNQCFGELEDPYYWTEDCQAMEEVLEELEESSEEEDDDLVNLKKLFNARKSASLKARVAIVRKNKAVQKKAPAFEANV